MTSNNLPTPGRDMPLAAFLDRLERLGFEQEEVGPKGDHWFKRGSLRFGPIFFPEPFMGWLSAIEIERAAEMIGVDLLDVYLAEE